MTRRPFVVSGVMAGVGMMFVELWPVILIWRAGASGSVGDLSQVRLLGVFVVYAALLGVVAGRLMTLALRRAEGSPDVGRFDPWGAYALGLGVYSLVVTAVPAIIYGLILTDENRSLSERQSLIEAVWIGGHLAAAVIAFVSARALLGRGHRAEVDATAA